MTGREIRAIRIALGLTQAQFGTFFGVQDRSVSRWETNSLIPTPHQIRVIERLARAIEVPPPPSEDIGKIILTAGAIVALSLLLVRALKADGYTT